ncbi:uncharacterized protein LOC108157769 isoform X1 [Drosophila miranda]|uniref:uncharacterized protein LOC108157769 isoform X1 n=1 Tax=Drosophila miranda TaxID=7229 RepID=UPI0007E6601E|nr:uncharacterized protein LOC108157769 isoform X1 [Drosophila miranda]
MDLSKAERQTPEGNNRQGGAEYLKGLLQDFLCFLIIIFAALLIGWGIFFVLDDSNEWKYGPRPLSSSVMPLQETAAAAERPCFRPRQWIPLYIFRSRNSQEPDLSPEMAEEPNTDTEQHQYALETKTQLPQVEEQPQVKSPQDDLRVDTDPAINQVESMPSSRLMDLFRRYILGRLAEDYVLDSKPNTIKLDQN